MINRTLASAVDVAQLLKELFRFRGRSRAAQSLGIPMLLRRRRKAELLGAVKRHWPGAYALTEAGELVYVPAPIEFQGEHVLFNGLGAHPAAFPFVTEGAVVLDVGANLGEWTVPLARRAGSSGRVLAFEPNPSIAAALASTLRINNLPQARVLQVAASNAAGSARFVVAAHNTGESRLGAPRPGDRTFEVRTRTLDEMVAEAALARVDLLKVDVEGHERWVIEGAMQTLRRFRPAVIIESAHEGPGERDAIAALFEGLGYDLVAVLHDFGALPSGFADYRATAGACAGTEARNLLLLPTRLDQWIEAEG